MRQISSTPSVVPTVDATVYIVLDNWGSIGSTYRETDVNQCDERTVIHDLINGEYNNPVQIVAFNVAEGWSRDVSEDIARDTIATAQRERTWLPPSTRGFIERVTGEGVPRELVDEEQ